MRVIAGVAKGHPLKGPKGAGTRPTADKVKGAVFSILESLLASRQGSEYEAGEIEETAGVWSGLRVLDLYAGTGALGIEALSRGAARADFVDSSPDAQRIIKENLERTRLAGRGRTLRMLALQALVRLPGVDQGEGYDVVLVDAPYGDPGLVRVLESLPGSGVLVVGGLVVVEHSRRTSLADSYDGLRLVRQRRHGDTELSIYVLVAQGRESGDGDREAEETVAKNKAPDSAPDPNVIAETYS